jgi:hypothetical protein
MTDPKETTSDTQVEQHNAGRPNDEERDPNEGSDVGGPASGIQSAAQNGMHQDDGVGDTQSQSQARNPL